MTIELPHRNDDGTTEMREYHDLDEVVTILPVHRNTARRKLAAHDWHGALFGNRWYMSDEDMADAVAEARGEGTYPMPTDDVPPLGAVVDDETLDDVGGVG